MIRTLCPGGCLLKVPAERAGTSIKCPKCQTVFLAKAEPGTTDDVSPPTFSPGKNEVIDDAPEIVSVDQLKLPTSDQMSARLARSKQDRILLARFLALLLGLIGAINLAPAVYQWHLWFEATTNTKIATWTFLQTLIAALQILYAVFLWQVQDWSALKSISIVMLIFAAFYGFVSTALMTGDSSSFIQRTMELPYTLLGTATIWSVTMLLLSVATSFLAMKEAMNWQRIEAVYKDLSANSSNLSQH